MPSVPGLRSNYARLGGLVCLGRMIDRIRLRRGWRDGSHELLRERMREYGLEGKPIETWFDLNGFDEGRDPVAERAWEQG